MHKHFFTAGPSALYPSVPDHMRQALKLQVPSLSHRSSDFQEIYRELVQQLRELLQLPEDFHVFILSSATEAWERILQNCVLETSHHFINGAFSERFAATAEDLGVYAEKISAPWGSCVQPEKAGPLGNPELIAITHNETSTGAMQPAEDIAFLRKAYPDALLAVDVVSSAPYLDFALQDVDTLFFSVQKGMGLPAGLGIWLVNERCIQKAEKKMAMGKSIGSYHSLPRLAEMAQKYQTPETPNVLSMYLLAKTCQDMVRRGRQAITNDTKYKAAVLYQLFDELDYLSAYVQKAALRSKTTAVARLENPAQQNDLLAYLRKKGYEISKGYGPLKNDCIRIANFPAHSREAVDQLSDILRAFPA